VVERVRPDDDGDVDWRAAEAQASLSSQAPDLNRPRAAAFSTAALSTSNWLML
jgi:hypothetical protein